MGDRHATLTPVLQACGIDGQVRRAPAMAAAMLAPSTKLTGGFRIIFVLCHILAKTL